MLIFYCLLFLGPPSQPQIFINPTDGVTEGDVVTMTCTSQPQSIPEDYRLDVKYTWRRADVPIEPNNPPPRHTVTGEDRGTLRIDVTDREDNGVEYQCVAQEETSSLESDATVTMDVKCKQEFSTLITCNAVRQITACEVICFTLTDWNKFL